uniref:Uncharacterized protein n=1 Tax=Siphoviridae sp. cteZR38 TaxID=2827906 RepID=A0A8S5SNE9_9CAUD|nr:MAG TPA: hypothetical protein [Siphoviridae sp. cteZR38]DAR12850.1 MAG TPA: hypothetical protein [Caudoviricetes sp.]
MSNINTIIHIINRPTYYFLLDSSIMVLVFIFML